MYKFVLLFIILIITAIILRIKTKYINGGGDSGGGDDEPPTEINIETDCYPRDLINECISFVNRDKSFIPFNAEMLTDEVARINKKYNSNITADAIIKIRQMELGMRSQRSGIQILKMGDTLLAASNNGESVLSLSRKYNLSPIMVLRQILSELNYSDSAIKNMLTNNSDELPPKFKAEINDILAADINSQSNMKNIHQSAQNYEEKVAKWLSDNGIKFTTEDELRKQNKSITPDFYLEEPIKINGQLIHWIDAKDYVLYGCKLVASKLKKQTKKYTETFGRGALIFSGGITCGESINIDNPPLLIKL